MSNPNCVIGDAMQLIIQKYPAHLYAKLTGDVSLLDFLQAIEKVMQVNDEVDLNVIWDLDDCFSLVKPGQFGNIVDYVYQRYPKQAKRSKLAIVASSGLIRAIVGLWSECANVLPYTIKTFMSLGEAEKWVVQK